MPAWSSFSYVFGPFMAFLGIGIFVIILRWAFSRGHSVVERPAKRGDSDQYGLMRPIASPSTIIEGEVLRQKLLSMGIKSNVALTNNGPKLMVWPEDVKRASEAIKQ